MSAEAVACEVELPFRVGARTLGRLRRRLVRHYVPVEQAVRGAATVLPVLPAEADGYVLRAFPESWLPALAADGLRPCIRQRYPRHYADLDQPFDRYWSGFSARARSGLKRKLRRLEAQTGAPIDVRAYRTPAEAEVFFAHARAVSALTYQERLLDAGLPADGLPDLLRLARQDRMRAWLLFAGGRPIAYLHAPAQGEALLYAHLGYDPAAAELSPGTLLQLEAMRMLMAERRFRWFDFTEGDGQHKRQFATGSIPSADLLLLRPTLGNRLAAGALGGFDRLVAAGKRVAGERLARRLRR